MAEEDGGGKGRSSTRSKHSNSTDSDEVMLIPVGDEGDLDPSSTLLRPSPDDDEDSDSELEILDSDDEDVEEEITIIEISDTEIMEEFESDIEIKQEVDDFDPSQLGVIITEAELPDNLLGEFRNGFYRCSFCPQKYPTKAKLIAHTERHISNGAIRKCRFCEFYSAVTQKLQEHEWKHTNQKPYHCNQCNFSCRLKGDLSKHQLVHSSFKRYKCKVCGHCTRTAANLKRHMEKHNPDMPRDFVCTLCGFAFKRDSALRSHMYRRHNDDKPFYCEQCPYRCKTAFEIRSHRMKHSTDHPYACSWPDCGKTFKTKSDCTKHSKRHSGVKNYMCSLCGKRFFTATHLKKHAPVHSEVRNFECEQCGKRFKTYRTLQSHIIMHQDYKPLECEVCWKRYSKQVNLDIHKRVHQEGRPYQCPICMHGSKEMDHLMAHIGFEHLSSFTYLCGLCRKPFGKSFQLQLHIQRCHKADMTGHEEALVYNPEYLGPDLQPEPSGIIDAQTYARCLAFGALQTRMADKSKSQSAKTPTTVTVKQEPGLPGTSNDSGVSPGTTDSLCTTGTVTTLSSLLPKDVELPPVVQVARYGGIPFCLARNNSGVKLNCRKRGKKPNRWFMDTTVMNEEDAERHKEYLRKKKSGLLPQMKRKRRAKNVTGATTTWQRKKMASGRKRGPGRPKGKRSLKDMSVDEDDSDEEEAYNLAKDLMIELEKQSPKSRGKTKRARMPSAGMKKESASSCTKLSAKAGRATAPKVARATKRVANRKAGKQAVKGGPKRTVAGPRKETKKTAVKAKQSSAAKRSGKKGSAGLSTVCGVEIKEEPTDPEDLLTLPFTSDLPGSRYSTAIAEANSNCWLLSLQSVNVGGLSGKTNGPYSMSQSRDSSDVFREAVAGLQLHEGSQNNCDSQGANKDCGENCPTESSFFNDKELQSSSCAVSVLETSYSVEKNQIVSENVKDARSEQSSKDFDKNVGCDPLPFSHNCQSVPALLQNKTSENVETVFSSSHVCMEHGLEISGGRSRGNLSRSEMRLDGSVSSDPSQEKYTTRRNNSPAKCLHVLVSDIHIHPVASNFLHSLGVKKVFYNTYPVSKHTGNQIKIAAKKQNRKSTQKLGSPKKGLSQSKARKSVAQKAPETQKSYVSTYSVEMSEVGGIGGLLLGTVVSGKSPTKILQKQKQAKKMATKQLNNPKPGKTVKKGKTRGKRSTNKQENKQPKPAAVNEELGYQSVHTEALENNLNIKMEAVEPLADGSFDAIENNHISKTAKEKGTESAPGLRINASQDRDGAVEPLAENYHSSKMVKNSVTESATGLEINTSQDRDEAVEPLAENNHSSKMVKKSVTESATGLRMNASQDRDEAVEPLAENNHSSKMVKKSVTEFDTGLRINASQDRDEAVEPLAENNHSSKMVKKSYTESAPGLEINVPQDRDEGICSYAESSSRTTLLAENLDNVSQLTGDEVSVSSQLVDGELSVSLAPSSGTAEISQQPLKKKIKSAVGNSSVSPAIQWSAHRDGTLQDLGQNAPSSSSSSTTAIGEEDHMNMQITEENISFPLKGRKTCRLRKGSRRTSATIDSWNRDSVSISSQDSAIEVASSETSFEELHIDTQPSECNTTTPKSLRKTVRHHRGRKRKVSDEDEIASDTPTEDSQISGSDVLDWQENMMKTSVSDQQTDCANSLSSTPDTLTSGKTRSGSAVTTRKSERTRRVRPPVTHPHSAKVIEDLKNLLQKRPGAKLPREIQRYSNLSSHCHTPAPVTYSGHASEPRQAPDSVKGGPPVNSQGGLSQVNTQDGHSHENVSDEIPATEIKQKSKESFKIGKIDSVIQPPKQQEENRDSRAQGKHLQSTVPRDSSQEDKEENRSPCTQRKQLQSSVPRDSSQEDEEENNGPNTQGKQLQSSVPRDSSQEDEEENNGPNTQGKQLQSSVPRDSSQEGEEENSGSCTQGKQLQSSVPRDSSQEGEEENSGSCTQGKQLQSSVPRDNSQEGEEENSGSCTQGKQLQSSVPRDNSQEGEPENSDSCTQGKQLQSSVPRDSSQEGEEENSGSCTQGKQLQSSVPRDSSQEGEEENSGSCTQGKQLQSSVPRDSSQEGEEENSGSCTQGKQLQSSVPRDSSQEGEEENSGSCTQGKQLQSSVPRDRSQEGEEENSGSCTQGKQLQSSVPRDSSQEGEEENSGSCTQGKQLQSSVPRDNSQEGEEENSGPCTQGKQLQSSVPRDSSQEGVEDKEENSGPCTQGKQLQSSVPRDSSQVGEEENSGPCTQGKQLQSSVPRDSSQVGEEENSGPCTQGKQLQSSVPRDSSQVGEEENSGPCTQGKQLQSSVPRDSSQVGEEENSGPNTQGKQLQSAVPGDSSQEGVEDKEENRGPSIQKKQLQCAVPRDSSQGDIEDEEKISSPCNQEKHLQAAVPRECSQEGIEDEEENRGSSAQGKHLQSAVTSESSQEDIEDVSLAKVTCQVPNISKFIGEDHSVTPESLTHEMAENSTDDLSVTDVQLEKMDTNDHKSECSEEEVKTDAASEDVKRVDAEVSTTLSIQSDLQGGVQMCERLSPSQTEQEKYGSAVLPELLTDVVTVKTNTNSFSDTPANIDLEGHDSVGDSSSVSEGERQTPPLSYKVVLVEKAKDISDAVAHSETGKPEDVLLGEVVHKNDADEKSNPPARDSIKYSDRPVATEKKMEKNSALTIHVQHAESDSESDKDKSVRTSPNADAVYTASSLPSAQSHRQGRFVHKRNTLLDSAVNSRSDCEDRKWKALLAEVAESRCVVLLENNVSIDSMCRAQLHRNKDTSCKPASEAEKAARCSADKTSETFVAKSPGNFLTVAQKKAFPKKIQAEIRKANERELKSQRATESGTEKQQENQAATSCSFEGKKIKQTSVVRKRKRRKCIASSKKSQAKKKIIVPCEKLEGGAQEDLSLPNTDPATSSGKKTEKKTKNGQTGSRILRRSSNKEEVACKGSQQEVSLRGRLSARGKARRLPCANPGRRSIRSNVETHRRLLAKIRKAKGMPSQVSPTKKRTPLAMAAAAKKRASKKSALKASKLSRAKVSNPLLKDGDKVKKRKKYLYVETVTGESPEFVPKKRGRRPGPKIVMDRSQANLCFESESPHPQAESLEQGSAPIFGTDLSSVFLIQAGVHQGSEHAEPLFVAVLPPQLEGSQVTAQGIVKMEVCDGNGLQVGTAAVIPPDMIASGVPDIKPTESQLTVLASSDINPAINKLGQSSVEQEQDSASSLLPERVGDLEYAEQLFGEEQPVLQTGYNTVMSEVNLGQSQEVEPVRGSSSCEVSEQGVSQWMQKSQHTVLSGSVRGKSPRGRRWSKAGRRKERDQEFVPQMPHKRTLSAESNSDRRRSERTKKPRLTEDELKKAHDSLTSESEDEGRVVAYTRNRLLCREDSDPGSDVEFVDADYSNVDHTAQRQFLDNLRVDTFSFGQPEFEKEATEEAEEGGAEEGNGEGRVPEPYDGNCSGPGVFGQTADLLNTAQNESALAHCPATAGEDMQFSSEAGSLGIEIRHGQNMEDNLIDSVYQNYLQENSFPHTVIEALANCPVLLSTENVMVKEESNLTNVPLLLSRETAVVKEETGGLVTFPLHVSRKSTLVKEEISGEQIGERDNSICTEDHLHHGQNTKDKLLTMSIGPLMKEEQTDTELSCVGLEHGDGVSSLPLAEPQSFTISFASGNGLEVSIEENSQGESSFGGNLPEQVLIQENLPDQVSIGENLPEQRLIEEILPGPE